MKKLYSVSLIASLIVLSSLVTYSAEAAGIPKKAISTSDQWATTDLPKGTMADGFLKASTDNTPSYSPIVVSDITDISSTYQALTDKNKANGYAGLDSGTKVPNSLLPDAVVRKNQTNTFAGFTQTFQGIINTLTNGIETTFVLFGNSGYWTKLQSGTLSGSNITVTLPTQTTTLVGRNTSDTLTGKTIDTSTNTISNLADANVKTGAAIAWSKISKSGSSIHDLANVTSTGCADGQILSVSGTTWRCTDRPFIPVLLQSDVTATSTTGVTVFTIPLVASSNNVIDGTLLEFTASAAVGVRAGAYFDTSGQAGVCQITTPESTTTAPVDNLVLTTSNLNTGSNAMAAANVPMPAVVDCTITTTATPGNLIITVAADSAATVKVLAGSYYTIVSK